MEQLAHPTRNVFSTGMKWREKTNQLHFGGGDVGAVQDREGGFSFVPASAGTIVETSILEMIVFRWSFLWSSLLIPHEMSLSTGSAAAEEGEN